MSDSLINCDAGRRLGCSTFCCRLLVRLDDNERDSGRDGEVKKSCIDKAPDGFCIHLDRDSERCRIWKNRPRVCREYNCNDDPMLQAAIRFGVKNIVQLSKDALRIHVPSESCTRVPPVTIAAKK